ncbi:MAG: hypothetical protein ACTH5W_18380 [Providencia sp.]|uniref:hypothetical protein n=1 Tax=Providencia sp. TaxID=589 RepID=UPI003F9ADA17
MKKIGDITNTADKNGEFTDGNVAAGTPPTQLMGAWFNSVQREILNVLAKAGVPQSATKEDQLAEAITKMVASAGYLPAGYSYSKTESDGKYQPKGNYAPSGDYVTNTALANGLALKFDKASVVQGIGISTIQVMSQDAATKAFIRPGYYGLGSTYGQSIPNNDYNSIKQSGFFAGIGGAAGENIPPKTSFGDVRYGAALSAFRSNQEGFVLFAHQYEIMLRTFENASWRECVSLLTERNTKLDRNGYFRSPSSTMEIEGIPIGASILWNTSAPIPDNFWPNEGRSFSAGTYPELAKIYPSLKLPDDRGYGIRIADNGRGIDAGRQVGTYQEDQIQNITGEWGAASGENSVTSSGAFEATYKSGGRPSGAGGGTISVKFNAGNVVRAGTETRMKNVAKILITRVK